MALGEEPSVALLKWLERVRLLRVGVGVGVGDGVGAGVGLRVGLRLRLRLRPRLRLRLRLRSSVRLRVGCAQLPGLRGEHEERG